MEANLQKNQTTDTQALLQVIVDSILDKKGQSIVSLDLTNLEDAMADYFVICDGNSPPQIKAIAEHILFNAKKQLGELPTQKEGLNSTDWILLDYFSIVVHIFHKEKRDFYQLEELWGDAAITTEHKEDGTESVTDHLPNANR